METIFAELNLNARLAPLDRGELFEDPIDDILNANDWGEVTGGGSLLSKTGEVKSCDIDFEIVPEYKEGFIEFIKCLKIIPKGSVLKIDGEEINVGVSEGLALYLNGTDLDEEVYRNNDINVLINQLDEAVKEIGAMYSYFEGNTETALYYYGDSFSELNARIAIIVRNHPLCQKCRIEQIA